MLKRSSILVVIVVLAFASGYFVGERTHRQEVTAFPFDPAAFSSTASGEDIRANMKKLTENVEQIIRNIDRQKR